MAEAGSMKGKSLGQNDLSLTAGKLSKEYNVSDSTVKRYARKAEEFERLQEEKHVTKRKYTIFYIPSAYRIIEKKGIFNLQYHQIKFKKTTIITRFWPIIAKFHQIIKTAIAAFIFHVLNIR
ncbi:MAG: hypothetical protein U9R02_08695 [Thermodesulfobacteriota bacterium]|nr:hypothetical protein [Thermodesulfobacteriota bacterium]